MKDKTEMKEKIIKLKPCPFCGGEVKPTFVNKSRFLKCRACPAYFGLYSVQCSTFFLVEKWNKRQNEKTFELRRIAELECLLQELCDLQEGPPLIKYENKWNAVMKRSREVLDE